MPPLARWDPAVTRPVQPRRRRVPRMAVLGAAARQRPRTGFWGGDGQSRTTVTGRGPTLPRRLPSTADRATARRVGSKHETPSSSSRRASGPMPARSHGACPHRGVRSARSASATRISDAQFTLRRWRYLGSNGTRWPRSHHLATWISRSGKLPRPKEIRSTLRGRNSCCRRSAASIPRYCRSCRTQGVPRCPWSREAAGAAALAQGGAEGTQRPAPNQPPARLLARSTRVLPRCRATRHWLSQREGPAMLAPLFRA
jgi:hypothetical protein